MTTYKPDEFNAFNRYTNLLRDLVLKEQGSFDGIVLNSAKCEHCARICPSGIPRQLRGTDRVACPACVKHKALVSALTRELHGHAGAQPITAKTDTAELTAEVTAALRSAKKQQPRTNNLAVRGTDLVRLASGINRLRASLKDCKSEKERFERERIIAVSIAAYKRQSGGGEPPEPEPKKPDEVLP